MIASPAIVTPTPMPACAPVLRDELLVEVKVEVDDGAEDVEVVALVAGVEVVVVVDVDAVADEVAEEMDVGMKSSMACVSFKSTEGAGAEKVWLFEVEHPLSPSLQQAHKLLEELYLTPVRYS